MSFHLFRKKVTSFTLTAEGYSLVSVVSRADGAFKGALYINRDLYLATGRGVRAALYLGSYCSIRYIYKCIECVFVKRGKGVIELKWF